MNYNKECFFGYREPGVDTFLYVYPDSIHIHRKTASINFNIGRQYHFGHFIIDFAVGLGLKYRDVNHKDRMAPQDDMEMPIHPNAYYMAEKEGNYFRLNVPFSLKIGYTF